VQTGPKQNLPIEILLSWQIFLFFKVVSFILRECFATPVSITFVPGFYNHSIFNPTDN